MPSRDLKITVLGVDDTPKAFKSATKGAEGMADKFATASKAMALVGGAALSKGLLDNLDFEAGQSKMAAQLGLTAAESKKAGDVAGRLFSGAYGESMSDVQAAVSSVTSSITGMRTASSGDLEAMTAKALDLAAGFDLEVARSAQVAGQMITSGLARDGAHAMDLLTASMQKVPAAVRGDVLDAIDEYGPFMQSLGIEGEKAMGMLVAASARGMYGIDKTGDALKEFTIRATDMSTASKAGYDLLGMSQEDMTRQILAGGDSAEAAFGQIVTGLQNIDDPAKQSQAALALFGTPLEDLSVQEIPAFLASLTSAQTALGDTTGAAEKFGDTLNDNAKTRILDMQRSVQTWVRELATLPGPLGTAGAATAAFGSQALAAVGPIGQFMVAQRLAAGASRTAAATEAAAAASSKASILSRAATHVAAGARIAASAVASATRTSAAWAAAAVRTVASLAVMAAGFVAQGAAMAATTAVTAARVVAGWVLMGVQSMLQAARMAAAWLIAMGPVGWVIAAVIGLAILIIKNWDTIKRVTGQVWDWVSAKIGAVWNWIKGAIASGLEFVKNLFLNFTGPGLIIKHWETIKRVTGAAWDAIKGAVSGAISGVTQTITGLPGRILGALGDLGGLLLDAGKDLIRGLIRGIRSMVPDVGGAMSAVTNKVRRFLPGSPIEEGPLKSWNHGGAGVRLMDQLASGIASGAPMVAKAMTAATDLGDLAGMQAGGTGYINSRLAATADGAPREAQVVNNHITFNLPPGSDHQTAIRVRNELLRLQRNGMRLGFAP